MSGARETSEVGFGNQAVGRCVIIGVPWGLGRLSLFCTGEEYVFDQKSPQTKHAET